MISHRITLEYDSGAKVVGMLASCQPSAGAVEFIVLHDAKLIGSNGALVRALPEVTLSPNVTTGIALAEGPMGRDVR